MERHAQSGGGGWNTENLGARACWVDWSEAKVDNVIDSSLSTLTQCTLNPLPQMYYFHGKWSPWDAEIKQTPEFSGNLTAEANPTLILSSPNADIKHWMIYHL